MQELSMNVLDIAQNSVAAGARLTRISLNFDRAAGWLTLRVADDGRGMSPEMAARVTDPFCTSRKSRKVGLGLPFLKMAAELTGGSLKIESHEGLGTTVTATFRLGHIDLPPVGDIASTVAGLMQCNPDIDFAYAITVGPESFCVDSRDLKEILGFGASMADPPVALFVRQYIHENSDPLLKKGESAL